MKCYGVMLNRNDLSSTEKLGSKSSDIIKLEYLTTILKHANKI